MTQTAHTPLPIIQTVKASLSMIRQSWYECLVCLWPFLLASVASAIISWVAQKTGFAENPATELTYTIIQLLIFLVLVATQILSANRIYRYFLIFEKPKPAPALDSRFWLGMRRMFKIYMLISAAILLSLVLGFLTGLIHGILAWVVTIPLILLSLMLPFLFSLVWPAIAIDDQSGLRWSFRLFRPILFNYAWGVLCISLIAVVVFIIPGSLFSLLLGSASGFGALFGTLVMIISISALAAIFLLGMFASTTMMYAFTALSYRHVTTDHQDALAPIPTPEQL